MALPVNQNEITDDQREKMCLLLMDSMVCMRIDKQINNELQQEVTKDEMKFGRAYDRLYGVLGDKEI